jgi:hypothetical protein
MFIFLTGLVRHFFFSWYVLSAEHFEANLVLPSTQRFQLIQKLKIILLAVNRAAYCDKKSTSMDTIA